MIKSIYKLFLVAFLSVLKTDAFATEGKVVPTSLLGTGPLVLAGNSKVILDNISVANEVIMFDPSTFLVAPNTVSALSGVISGADMFIKTSDEGFGTLRIQGYSAAYTSTINAKRVNLLIDGTLPAPVIAQDSILGGTGFIGDVTLKGKSAIKPGRLPGDPISDMYINNLVVEDTAKHYVEINGDTEGSQIYVMNDATLPDNFSINVLLKAGKYEAGTIDYPIITSRTGRLITDSQKTLNWTARTATDGSDIITFNLGLSEDGSQLILQSVIKQPFTVTDDEITETNYKSKSIDAGARLAEKGEPAAQTPVYLNNQVTVSTEMLTSLPSGKPLNVSGGTISNDSNTPQTITTSIKVTADSVISTHKGAETIITTPIKSTAGTTLGLSGGGTTTFSADNTSTLKGNISVSGSTVNIGNGANLGTGELNVKGGATINLGAKKGDSVFLQNIVTVSDPSAFITPPGAQSTFGKEIIGTGDLNLNGGGNVRLTADSPNYSGTLNANSGKVAMNSAMPQANVAVGPDAVLSGNGTMKDVLLSGKIKPGNSIGVHTVDSLTTTSGASYDVELNASGNSNQIFVNKDATLNGIFDINALLNQGDYPAGTIDYPIIVTKGKLDIDTLNVRWNDMPEYGLAFTAGKLSDPTSTYDGKVLVLRYIAEKPFTIDADQTAIDTSAEVMLTNPQPLTINQNDILAPGGILVHPTQTSDFVAVPVAEQVELTNLVFLNNPSNQDSAFVATSDSFCSKGSRSIPSSSDGKSALQTLLTAIAKNGPVSYERNETRLWISPFATRSRANPTNSSVGSQGWSGGSLMGLEQRDKNNIWSLGLLSGLTGSKSHNIGDPNTFSKTAGLLFGAFNTYKYTNHKDKGNFGHEILVSRTITSIDAQRYGIDQVDKKTPFYALGSYKTKTDIANAQLNYLFNIIKKSVTCRFDIGTTYSGVKSGQFSERNAGLNGINMSENLTQSLEHYGGIGLRKIWNNDKKIIRTTFVYEYGYQAKNSGSGAKVITQSSQPTTFMVQPGPRQNKHYLQLNTSYLDRDTGLKFVASYSGTLYKNVQNHTGMIKVEFRF